MKQWPFVSRTEYDKILKNACQNADLCVDYVKEIERLNKINRKLRQEIKGPAASS